MMSTLESQVALVTGAGAGIGRAIVVERASRGARMALHYHRSREGAEDTAKQLCADGHKAIVLGGDLTVKANADRIVAETTEALGPLDILVNNAGDLVERRALADMSEELWRKIFDLNVSSTFFCAQAAARVMVHAGAAPS